MNQLIFVNKLSILFYISLFWIVIAEQDLNLPEEKLQSFKDDDADFVLNKLNKNFDQDSSADLLNSFDSSIYYKIDWKERPDDFVLDDNNASIVSLTTKHLNKYHCILPQIDEKEQSNKEDAKIDAYSKIERLFSSKKNCIYKLDSYWTYEICLNEYIRQFNGDILEKKHTQEYYLGYFNKMNLERNREEYKKRVEMYKAQGKGVPKIDREGVKVPYIYLTMTDGTVCDLTNKPRQTIVYFVCDKQEKPQLESIEEIKSCEYEAIVSTSLLCEHPDFKEKKESEFQINCYPNANSDPIKPVGLSQYDTLELSSETLLQQFQDMMSNSKFKIEIKELDMFNKQNKNTKIKTVDKSKYAIDDLDIDIDKELTIENVMSGKSCFLNTFKIYWRYNFCFKKSIEMFHEEAGVRTQTIKLGTFDENKHLDWLDKNPEV